MPADHVRCELLVWGGDRTALASISGFPATTQPFEVAFDTGLTLEAATICEMAFESAQPSGALVFWLSCPARRPALDATITMNGRESVRGVTARAGAGPLHYGQITRLLASLREEGHIRIESTSDAEDVIAQTNDAIERAVLANMFESSPGIGPGFESRARLSPEQLGFETRQFTPKADPGGLVTLDLSTPEDTHVTLARAATIAELLEPFGGRRAGLVTETERAPIPEETAMPERSITVLSSVDLEISPIRMIEVELCYGAERHDVVLDRDCQRQRVAFTAADGTREIQYRYRVYLHQGVAGAHRFDSPAETTDASVLIVDPFRWCASSGSTRSPSVRPRSTGPRSSTPACARAAS